ncbi:hypothetical protein B0H13DRAFT_1856103 [Mycena leptocephala]|nr:hypothetical protein B0H13DRAFT_1856103 [Mycena leptocephala]
MSGTLYPSRTVVRINPATDSRETRWNERLIPDRRKEGDERIWINEKDTHRSASVSRLQKGAREDVTDPDVCGSIEQTRFRVDGGSLCGGYELGASTQATIPRCQEGQKLLVGRYCSLRMKTGRNADPMSGSPASLPIAFGTSQRQDHIGTIPEHSLEGSGHCECRIRTGGKLVNGNKHWLCPVQSLAKLESPDESGTVLVWEGYISKRYISKRYKYTECLNGKGAARSSMNEEGDGSGNNGEEEGVGVVGRSFENGVGLFIRHGNGRLLVERAPPDASQQCLLHMIGTQAVDTNRFTALEPRTLAVSGRGRKHWRVGRMRRR